MCAHEYPGALMSMMARCHEHSWVLMSAHSLMVVPYSWLHLWSHECSLLHGTKLMSVHGCSWVLNGNQEHSWLLLAAYECSWVLMGAHECSWMLMSAHECSLEALKRSRDLGVMEQWVPMRAKEQSWARGYEDMSAHEHSWALMAP